VRNVIAVGKSDAPAEATTDFDILAAKLFDFPRPSPPHEFPSTVIPNFDVED
jgi:hypothetical protein